jgi:hypothetical protein
MENIQHKQTTPTAPPLQRKKLSLPTGTTARVYRPASSPPPISTSKWWSVWMLNGARPKRRHGSKEAATREAERLAGNNPGHVYLVIECVAVARRWVKP